MIIATAKSIQQEYDKKRKTILVSRDINMRVICDALGLPAEDYASERAVTSSDELYQGFVEYLVDDQLIDQFYNDEEIFFSKDEVPEAWCANQYLMLISNANPKKTCLARL